MFRVAVFVFGIILYYAGYGIASVCLIPLMVFFLFQKKSSKFNPQGRAIFITGCDCGFGYQLAKRLDEKGFTVFAACLLPEEKGANNLVSECSSRLKVLKVDVTRDEDVAEAKKMVESNLPEKGLWGVVNNAGISNWAETEWSTIQDYQAISDVNLFGSIRTTLAFIPLIQASKGRMAFMSSISGIISFPGTGIYSITKKAIEAFADCLRTEMACYDVKVCIIEPGNFAGATNIQREKTADEIWNKFDDEQKKRLNREIVELINHKVNKQLKNGSKNSDLVIDAIVDALTSPSPKARYLVANVYEKIAVCLFTHSPTFITDALIMWSEVYQKKRSLLLARTGNLK
ncbi:BDH protein, partial [Polyodon spathula]|nr:BDH protein [Polyodon spathula]